MSVYYFTIKIVQVFRLFFTVNVFMGHLVFVFSCSFFSTTQKISVPVFLQQTHARTHLADMTDVKIKTGISDTVTRLSFRKWLVASSYYKITVFHIAIKSKLLIEHKIDLNTTLFTRSTISKIFNSFGHRSNKCGIFLKRGISFRIYSPSNSFKFLFNLLFSS